MPRTTHDIALEINQQRELLQRQRTNLHRMRLQGANYGVEPPLHIANQIEQIEEAVRTIEEAIARLELEAAEVARTESRAERERQLVEAFLVQSTRSAGVKTAQPMALALCLLPSLRSIKGDVEAFLHGQGWSMPVQEICMPGINGIDDVARLVVALQLKKQEIQEGGYSEVHLFIAGPVVAGVAVGGIFDNWKPVKLYQRANPSSEQLYEYWMPLIAT